MREALEEFGCDAALSTPMTRTAIRELSRVYERLQHDQGVESVTIPFRSIDSFGFGGNVASSPPPPAQVSRDDLHLVCFDFVWS